MGKHTIPLAGISVTDLCILRDGPPPVDFAQLGFAEPEIALPSAPTPPEHDNTY